MKPIIIGEAPSKNETTEGPIEGRVGRLLADLCNLPFAEFLEMFERCNLLQVRQDTKEKGFEFDEVAASLEAARLWHNGTLAEGRIVLLLGKRVATAFSAETTYFKEQRLGTKAKVYVLPHPSGVNRWWNEPTNRIAGATFMLSVVKAVDPDRGKVTR